MNISLRHRVESLDETATKHPNTLQHERDLLPFGLVSRRLIMISLGWDYQSYLFLHSL
jgi:hypothetical protein